MKSAFSFKNYIHILGIGFGKRIVHHSSTILYGYQALHLATRTLSTYQGLGSVK
jgi:hypothetical protein